MPPGRARAGSRPAKEDHVRRLLIGILTMGLVGVGSRAQRASPPASQDSAAPRILTPDTARLEPGKKSDTDYWLDSQIIRLIARYPEATLTTERGIGGVVTSRVADRNGNVAANLTVRSNLLQFAPVAGDPYLAANDSGERPTLETASRQAYSLWKDGTRNLRWQHGLLRHPDAKRDLEPLELQTEWAQGLTAHAQRTFNATVRVKLKGRDAVLSGEVVATRLTRDGAEIGSSVWFPAQQTFMFSVGNVKGSIDAAVLSEQNNGPGGWSFTVTSAWVNQQTIAFQYFASLPKPAVAQDRSGCGRTGTLARITGFFFATVQANRQGCDWPFVWLNGTSFEPCCNRHDVCYAAYGCTWKTWWMFWTSWRCDVCNLLVYNCFMYGGDTWNPGDA
jgi:hypothetical protein